LQAAVLLVKLKYFADEINARNKAAQRYNEQLSKNVRIPVVPKEHVSVYAQYVIQVENRDGLKDFLSQKGIPTAIHYPKPLHLQKAFKDLGYTEGAFPLAEEACRKVLALPMHAFLTEEIQNFIIDHINSFFKK